jgi:hypothetical protein
LSLTIFPFPSLATEGSNKKTQSVFGWVLLSHFDSRFAKKLLLFGLLSSILRNLSPFRTSDRSAGLEICHFFFKARFLPERLRSQVSFAAQPISLFG